MSAATFNASGAMRYTTSRFNGGRLLKGVCAEIAERAGVAVWMPRAAFVVFGLMHWFLAVILYVVLVKVMAPARRRLADLADRPAAAATAYGSVRDRFSALDARLADLEAASLQQEAALRRQFRDLER